MDTFLIARRSLYNKLIQVKGYDLLFQSTDAVQDPSAGSALTTADLADTFADENLQHLIGHGLVMVNFSAAMLHEEIPASIPKQRLIIVVNGHNTRLDQAMLSHLQALKAKGYKIAVSDVLTMAELTPLFSAISLVKLDISAIEPDKLATLAAELAQHPIEVLAYNIQTHDAFDRCKALGFALFSGYFLDLPNLDSGKKVSSNRMTTMRLLVSLDDPNISVDTVEELISQDARLGYRLLKAVNSAAYGLPRTVSSLREAVVFLGLKQIRSWTSMIIITCQDEKPSDLLLNTMIRARMCELMAEQIGADDPKSYFTVGLFSTLDAILDRKMADLLKELNLNEELQDALLQHEGELGAMLQNVIAYGHGKWQELGDSGIDMEVWRDAYMDSVNWATTSFSQLTA